jgi:hypothetical protein
MAKYLTYTPPERLPALQPEMGDAGETGFDALARYQTIHVGEDQYPNQPPIEEWPMSDQEWMEMQTLDAIAAIYPEMLSIYTARPGT